MNNLYTNIDKIYYVGVRETFSIILYILEVFFYLSPLINQIACGWVKVRGLIRKQLVTRN